MSRYSDRIKITEIPDFDRQTANGPLRPSRNVTNLSLIGSPRGTYGKNCEYPDDKAFIKLLETADFGPFRATGIRPAVRRLHRIMEDIAEEHPDLLPRLSTAGMLCCRLVRGSTSSISNHSWGTAIDLKIDGELDNYGDGYVQRGLLDIWPIFNRHDFFWGIGFSREDSMHFEASEQLVRKWAKAGEFGPVSDKPLARALTYGDRGLAVLRLQEALNTALHPVHIEEDGIFGKHTRAAVFAFQRLAGLAPTGNASRAVLEKLGLS